MAEEKLYLRRDVHYPCTNESILAVVAGLDLRSDDVVVSVAGSGDMPFAIAPYVKKVYAVDSDICQIRFMKEQLEYLKEGRFVKFCRGGWKRENMDACWEHLVARRDYFESNFAEAREALSKIEIVNSDILWAMKSFPQDSFDKVYLSNALSWGSCRKDSLGYTIGGVKDGGLIYETLAQRHINKFSRSKKLKVDFERTSEARRIQMKEHFGNYDWRPVVYEKVGNLSQ